MKQTSAKHLLKFLASKDKTFLKNGIYKLPSRCNDET